jgi:hypothetical protein
VKMGIVDIVGSNKRLVIGETGKEDDQRSMTTSLKRAIMPLQQPERAQVYLIVTVANLALLPAC